MTSNLDYTNDLLTQLNNILECGIHDKIEIIAASVSIKEPTEPIMSSIIEEEHIKEEHIKEPTVSNSATNLETQLNQYIAGIEQNGIKQHSEKWKLVRKLGVGGSQIASILGCNPYGTLRELLYSKTEVVKFESNEKMQWGNLFEELVKLYVERDKKITIFGEDIFIDTIDVNGLYYSPDGLTVMDGAITLIEFKGPFSRIPNKCVPVSYVPQMKMGMEIIGIAVRSLYAEAVFRYCSAAQMGFGKDFNKGMGQKNTGKKVLASGFITFSISAQNLFHPAVVAFICGTYYSRCARIGETDAIADFGTCDTLIPLLALTDAMDSTGTSLIVNRTYNMCLSTGESYPVDYHTPSQFLELLHSNPPHGQFLLGILPWKLIRVDYHTIEKDTGYLARADKEISEFIGVVRDCYGKESAEKKRIIDAHIDGEPKLNANGKAVDLANDTCDIDAFF